MEKPREHLKIMKTTSRTQNIQSPPPIRWHRWSAPAVSLLLAALLLPTVTLAGANKSKARCEPCRETARLMYSASVSEAMADYFVAVANANNEPTPAERAASKKQAKADYDEAVSLAKEQRRERFELCEELDEERYNPVINPADFLTVAQTAAAPNPLFPLVPGTTYNFRSVTDEGTETTEFTVTRDTRTILGVTCIVVRDIVRLDGNVIEDTVDWFAQDRSGNVWYFGENTAEYEDGLITTTAGSWEAGVNGARAGIIMFAQPVVGKVYRQELMLGEAEDAAEVIALSETVTVPAGTFINCLQTEDFTPLDPDNSEFKYYAPGVGNVLTINPDTGRRDELISVTHN
jgi:hypothetical protein